MCGSRNQLVINMSSVTFDSYPIYTELKESGFNDQQAEAMVNTFKRVYEGANLATKGDIKELRHEMREMRYQIIISLGGMLAVAVVILAGLIKLV